MQGLFDAFDLQIQTAATIVDLGQHHHDLVAETEDATPLFTGQRVLRFVEDVEIVTEGADRHQAVDVVVDELDEDSERLDAGDSPFEHLTGAAGEEPHELPLENDPLGPLGPPLGETATLADRRHPLGQ